MKDIPSSPLPISTPPQSPVPSANLQLYTYGCFRMLYYASRQNFANMGPQPNGYHSKSRLEMLCRKPVSKYKCLRPRPQFPESFLENENPGQHVIMHSGALDHLKLP